MLYIASIEITPASSIGPQSPMEIAGSATSSHPNNIIEFPFHLAAGAYENFTYNFGSSSTAKLTVYAHPFSPLANGKGTVVDSVTLSDFGSFSYHDTGQSNVVTMYFDIHPQLLNVPFYINVTITSYYPNELNPVLLIPSVLIFLGFAIGMGWHVNYMTRNPEAYWYGIEETGKVRDPTSTRRQSMQLPLQKRRNYTTIYLFIVSIVLMLSAGLGFLYFLHDRTTIVVIGSIGVGFLFISIASATVAYLIGENEDLIK